MPEITEEKVNALIKALDWISKNVWPFLAVCFLCIAGYMFYLLQECQSEAKKEGIRLQDKNDALTKEMYNREVERNRNLDFIYKNIQRDETPPK